MTDCVKYYELISGLVDGEITDREAEELNAHLAGCPSCAALLDAYKEISEAAEGQEPPESLTRGVMRKIKTVRLRRRAARWLPIAACAAVVFIAAPVLLHRGGGNSTGSAGDAPIYAVGDALPPAAAPQESGYGEAPRKEPGDSDYLGYDAGTSEAAGFSAAPDAPENSNTEVAGDAVAGAGVIGAELEKYCAVVYLRGALPEGLEDFERTERTGGVYWIEIPRETLAELSESIPIEPGGDALSDIALAVYTPG